MSTCVTRASIVAPLATPPAGQRKISGTLRLVSTMLSGHAPLPLPQSPWCPVLNPWSLVKTTSVSSSTSSAVSASSTRWIAESIAVTAAKYPFRHSRRPSSEASSNPLSV